MYPLSPVSGLRGNDEMGGRKRSPVRKAGSCPRNIIFVPMTGGDLVYDYGVNVRGVNPLLEQR